MAHPPKNTEKFSNPVVQWIDERLPIFTMLIKEYGVFPMPKNANYMWSFGGIAMTMLMIMIVTAVMDTRQWPLSISYYLMALRLLLD